MRRNLSLCCALFAAPLAGQVAPMSVVADSAAHSVLGQLATLAGSIAEVS